MLKRCVGLETLELVCDCNDLNSRWQVLRREAKLVGFWGDTSRMKWVCRMEDISWTLGWCSFRIGGTYVITLSGVQSRHCWIATFGVLKWLWLWNRGGVVWDGNPTSHGGILPSGVINSKVDCTSAYKMCKQSCNEQDMLDLMSELINIPFHQT